MSMVFALVLLGCADDGSACERLSTPAEIHATRAQCLARQDSALASEAAMTVDYPTVVTRCLPHNGMAAGRAKLVVRARR